MEANEEEIASFASGDEDEDSYTGRKIIGHPRVELFGVKINCRGYVYGKITFGNLNYPNEMFHRTSENAQFISLEGDDNLLLLTGPPDAVCCGDEVLIDVDLTHRDVPEPTEDKLKWQIGFGRNFRQNLPDNPPSYMEIHGNNDKLATVYYAEFNNAPKAFVEIRLIQGADKRAEKEIPVGVHGLIASSKESNDITVGEDYESILFRIREEESGQVVKVAPGELIPLSRHAVSVPFGSHLIVRADLCTKDGENFRARRSFCAKRSGITEKFIKGKDRKLLVRITWSNDW